MLECVQGGALYIAMAGQHQIWRHDLRAGTTGGFSGDGFERNANGRSGPGTSWAQVTSIEQTWRVLAQPFTAQSINGVYLFVHSHISTIVAYMPQVFAIRTLCP